MVLLHECYPYTREGGYLAAVYENVYLDLSYGIPLLGYGEMFSFTRQALGVAPTPVMYRSDGIGVPEIHWMSAIDGRRVIGQALEELVAHGELTIPRPRPQARVCYTETRSSCTGWNVLTTALAGAPRTRSRTSPAGES